MAYTDIDKPSDYFNTVLYTGNSTDNRTVTGVGFQPDFLWIKDRTVARIHYLADRVRGDTKYLQSQATTAELTATTAVKSIDSDGFTTGTSTTVNNTGENYVAWNWLAGGTAVSNTQGSITSSVSANTTAGFSIVSYTGTGASATVGHGLGVALKMIIVKNRSAVSGWKTWHSSLGGGDKVVELQDSGGVSTNASPFNSTVPTSSVFTIANFSYTDTNVSGQNFVAYCFAEKKGFSKFGSYVGNGSADGTFVYTGFKPAMIIFKNASTVANWGMVDNKRDDDNVVKARLFPNLPDTESSSFDICDFTANGFKLRTTDSQFNSSGHTIIYMAFAENPFTTSTGIPSTAR